MDTETTYMPIPIGLFETAFTSEHVPDLIDGEQTHEAGLTFVAQLVSHTQDEGQIQGLIAAALPENYSGNTLAEVPEMVKSALAKGMHLPKDKKKSDPKLSEVCVRLVEEKKPILFHNKQKEGYISIPQEGGGELTFHIRSRMTRLWLQKTHYDAQGQPIASQTLNEVIDTLEARALFRGPRTEINLRTAGDDKHIIIDLGRDDASVVVIDKNVWTITTVCPVKFVRPASLRELPEPARGGNLEQLRDLLGLDQNIFVLTLAFILNCLRPNGPYYCMLVEGEQGSGKSFYCSILKWIIDPSLADRLRLPKTEQDLMIQASENALLAYDNASGVKWDMSDALCTLSTGGGFSTRKLYTNTETVVLNFCRPFIINGIGDYASRPDLLERAVRISLPAIPKGSRKTEKEMIKEFNEILPGILGELYDIVAAALGNMDEVEPPTELRMADAAQWLVAAEPACGLPDGTFIDALSNNQKELMIDKVINDPLVYAINKVIERKPFEGTFGDLFNLFDDSDYSLVRSLPKTPSHLSNALKRLRPALKHAGIEVEFGDRTRKGKTVQISYSNPDDYKAPLKGQP